MADYSDQVEVQLPGAVATQLLRRDQVQDMTDAEWAAYKKLHGVKASEKTAGKPVIKKAPRELPEMDLAAKDRELPEMDLAAKDREPSGDRVPARDWRMGRGSPDEDRLMLVDDEHGERSLSLEGMDTASRDELVKSFENHPAFGGVMLGTASKKRRDAARRNIVAVGEGGDVPGAPSPAMEALPSSAAPVGAYDTQRDRDAFTRIVQSAQPPSPADLIPADAPLTAPNALPPAMAAPVEPPAPPPPTPEENARLEMQAMVSQPPVMEAYKTTRVPTAEELDAENIKAAKQYAATSDEVFKHAASNVAEQHGVMSEMKALREQAAADEIEKQRNVVEGAQKIQRIAVSTLEEARRVSSQGVDPNRFWNNKSGAQKAMAVLAGALFGFAGKGMEYLQRLDALVAQDIDAQEADRAAAVHGLENLARGQFDARDFAIRAGASEAEARHLAIASRFEGFKAHLEGIAMSNVPNQIKMRAAEMAVQMAQHSTGVRDATELRQKQNMIDNKAIDERNAMRASVYAARLKAVTQMANGGTGVKHSLKPGQTASLSERRNALVQLSQLEKEYDDNASTIGSSFAQILPGTKAYNFMKNVHNVYMQTLGRPMEGGVLKEQDIARYRKMFAGATTTRGGANAAFRALRNSAVGAIKNDLAVLDMANYDVARFKTDPLLVVEEAKNNLATGFDVAGAERSEAPSPQEE